MNKMQYIAHVADKMKTSKAEAARWVEIMLESFTTGMKKFGEVNIVGFGKFYVSKQNARTGRNPRTGEPIKIKASKQPKFKAGKPLKEAVN